MVNNYVLMKMEKKNYKTINHQNLVNGDWRFLKTYKNSISNLNLNLNFYYKFSNTIPKSFNWYSLNNNKYLIHSFTKKIFNQVSSLFY